MTAFDPQDQALIEQERAERQRLIEEQQSLQRQEELEREEIERLERLQEQDDLEDQRRDHAERDASNEGRIQRMRTRFGALLSSRRSDERWSDDGDGEEDNDAIDDDVPSADVRTDSAIRARPASASASATAGGLGLGFILIVLLLVAGVGFVGFKWLGGKSDPAESAQAPAAVLAGLPRAEPQQEPLQGVTPRDGQPTTGVEATAPGTAPEPTRAALHPATPPADVLAERTGSALADPVSPPVNTTVPSESVAAASGAAPASVSPEIQPDAATDEASPLAVASIKARMLDSSEPSVTELKQRIAMLEEELQAIQAERAPVASTSTSKSTPTPKAEARPTPKPRPAPAAVKGASRKKTPAPPALQAELLAIDVWDGQPSVVVGTNAPGDRRVRTLQPGDTLNGITLKSVDVAGGRASFAASDGGVVTLNLNSQQASP